MGKELEKLNPNIFLIEDDVWWTKQDIGAYEYLKHTNTDTLKKLIPHLKDNKVAVQAGAHCGWVIRELKKHFETIYTFEPDPYMFLCLCMNIPDETVYKFQACLGNEHKLVSMSLETAVGSGYISGVGKIPVLKIDDLNLTQCDLIQLDVEGYEYFALQGAINTIEKFKPLLCIERYWGPTHCQISEEQMNEFLKSLGYILVDTMLPDYIYKCG
jgi:FkbM family methyltransferase